jgi:hypothetical protein
VRIAFLFFLVVLFSAGFPLTSMCGCGDIAINVVNSKATSYVSL